MSHQIRIGKATVCQEDDLTVKRDEELGRLVQQVFVCLEGHGAAWVFEHLPDEGNRSPAVHNRDADDAIPSPQHRGVQSQVENTLSPSRQGLLNQWPVEFVNFDAIVVQPASESTDDALSILSPALDVWCPRSQANDTGLDELQHHPGQRFEVTSVQPVLVMPQDNGQRIVQA